MDDSFFVFSSWEPVPDFYFDGYCFLGNDFVHGMKGAESYRVETGHEISPGEDGSYIVAKRTGDELTIGADFRGNARLFYFSNGSDWAVSNSLIFLAEFLTARGLRLHADMNHLASWFSSTVNFKQITSEKTTISEISFLAADQCLVAGPSGIRTTNVVQPKALDYDEALRIFLETWHGRVATVLAHSSFPLATAISGGLDSRTTVCLLKAIEGAGTADTSAIDLFTCVGPRFQVEERVAAEVAENIGFPLRRSAPDWRQSRLEESPAQAVQRWRHRSLGQYAPILFTPPKGKVGQFALTGGGGEALREVYDFPDVEGYFSKQRKFYGKSFRRGKFKRWRADVTNSINKISDRATMRQSPLMGYFRQFRGRCHAGQGSMRGLQIQPLTSRAAYACIGSLTEARVKRRQFYFDVMFNSYPDLLNVPFETDAKSPTPDVFDNLRKVEIGTYKAGRFFTDAGARQAAPGEEKTDAYKLIKCKLEAERADMPTGLLRRGYFGMGLDSLDAYIEDPTKVGMRGTIPAHNLVLLNEISRLTGIRSLPFFGGLHMDQFRNIGR